MTPPLLTYPARPTNGGRLESAPAKVGPWIVQPKIDDWRGLVHCPTGRIWNRHGTPMSIAGNLETTLMILANSPFPWLDVGVMERRNQLLRDSIVVFDCIFPFAPATGYHNRRRVLLEAGFPVLPFATGLKNGPTSNRVFLIPDFELTPALEIYERLQQENREAGSSFYEGIVCKRADKPYPIQLRSPNEQTPWMVKHRFDQ